MFRMRKWITQIRHTHHTHTLINTSTVIEPTLCTKRFDYFIISSFYFIFIFTRFIFGPMALNTFIFKFSFAKHRPYLCFTVQIETNRENFRFFFLNSFWMERISRKKTIARKFTTVRQFATIKIYAECTRWLTDYSIATYQNSSGTKSGW